jgi:hypothetical protein
MYLLVDKLNSYFGRYLLIRKLTRITEAYAVNIHH